MQWTRSAVSGPISTTISLSGTATGLGVDRDDLATVTVSGANVTARVRAAVAPARHRLVVHGSPRAGWSTTARVTWRSSSDPVVELFRRHGFRWTYGRADAHHFDG